MILKCIVLAINLLIKALGALGQVGLSLLPDSPFQSLQMQIVDIPYLSNVAWVIPFDFMINVLLAWVVAIGFYYVAQVILRWVKVIQ